MSQIVEEIKSIAREKWPDSRHIEVHPNTARHVATDRTETSSSGFNLSVLDVAGDVVHLESESLNGLRVKIEQIARPKLRRDIGLLLEERCPDARKYEVKPCRSFDLADNPADFASWIAIAHFNNRKVERTANTLRELLNAVEQIPEERTL